LRTVVMQAWQRLREFIFKAGQVIVPIVMVLSFFNALGTDGSFGKEDSRDSVLAAASQSIVPVFKPMGLTEENWPAAVGLFTGIFAKEAVVGTLNTLYTQAAEQDAAAEAEAASADGETAAVEEEAPETLSGKLLAAAATIPENLLKVADSLGDPLGLDVSYVSDSGAAAEELEVGDGTFGAMVARFTGVSGAMAYMVLILLYTPCVAALGAIRHETSMGWTLFATGWTTMIGYTASVSVYQAANFAADPATATLWLSLCAGTLVTLVSAMWMVGRAQARRLAATMPAE